LRGYGEVRDLVSHVAMTTTAPKGAPPRRIDDKKKKMPENSGPAMLAKEALKWGDPHILFLSTIF